MKYQNLSDFPEKPCVIVIGHLEETFFPDDLNTIHLKLGEDEHQYKLEDFEPYNRILSIRPLDVRFRNFIIWNAEKVPVLIWNKLLKILEETKFNRFILMTPNLDTILQTVRSRAVVIRLEEEVKKSPIYNEEMLLSDLKKESIENIDSLWAYAKQSLISSSSIPFLNMSVSYYTLI